MNGHRLLWHGMEYKMDIMLCDRINNVKFVLSQYSEATRSTSTTDNVI